MVLSPDLVRELTALAYLCAFGLAFRALRRRSPNTAAQTPLKATVCSLGVMAAIKWLHLQLWLWQWGRMLFRQYDLYSQRALFQLIVIPLLVALAGALLFVRYLRRSREWVLLLPLLYLALLTGLRTLSLHDLDTFFEREIVGLRLYWLLEWAGLAWTILHIRRLST